MTAASTFSRRKIFSKVRVTEVVPAPDDPVIAMMGCLADMGVPGSGESVRRSEGRGEQAALAEEGRLVAVQRLLGVVLLDAADFLGRAEDEADALVQRI